MIAVILLLLLALVPQRALAQQPFVTQCAACHGEEGRGTAKGPGLAMNPRVAEQSVRAVAAYLQRGNPAAGMPSFADLPPRDLRRARALPAPSQRGHNPASAARRRPGSQNRLGHATTGRLAHLQRLRLGQSVQPAQADHHSQRGVAQVEVGLPYSVFRARDDTPGRGRDAVCHRTQPGVRPRCADRRGCCGTTRARPAWGWSAMHGWAPTAASRCSATRSIS